MYTQRESPTKDQTSTKLYSICMHAEAGVAPMIISSLRDDGGCDGRSSGGSVAEAAEPEAGAGGEEGEPGDERRAEEDEADGHHPQLLVRRVERHRPPHQHAGACEPHSRHARRRRPRRPPFSLRSDAARLQGDDGVAAVGSPPAAAGRLGRRPRATRLSLRRHDGERRGLRGEGEARSRAAGARAVRA
ncbi:unnamed protein product [Urochloa humidicola]